MHQVGAQLYTVRNLLNTKEEAVKTLQAIKEIGYSSVQLFGNAERIFEPYRAMCGATREETTALFEHFLVFYNVGDRSWAISQNVLLGGRDADGNDLTNETTYAILDAYYDMNLPQPILSVKLHQMLQVESEKVLKI